MEVFAVFSRVLLFLVGGFGLGRKMRCTPICVGPFARPSQAELISELLRHANGIMSYVVALSWTHVILPLLGGPSRFSIAHLMTHKFRGPFLVFMWVYTMLATSVCWWWFQVGDDQAARFVAIADSSDASLVERVWAAVWRHSSSSMAWVGMYMWMCVLLGTLPTATPLESLASAAVLTVAVAAAVLAGQRGRGPLTKVFRRASTERVTMVVFFASWMTATVWVGAITACVGAAGVAPWAASWLVALSALAARWWWLWHLGTDPSRSDVATAEIYPASLDAGLRVGLLVADSAPPQPARSGAAGASVGLGSASVGLGSASVGLGSASVGLGSLALAWGACVALQAASSSTWSSWEWREGTASVVATLAYSAALSAVCVGAVATARARAAALAAVTATGRPAGATAEAAGPTAADRTTVDGGPADDAPPGPLDAETAALAVACGWSWYNALSTLCPALVAPSTYVRAAAAVGATAVGVVVLLALKPSSRLLLLASVAAVVSSSCPGGTSADWTEEDAPAVAGSVTSAGRYYLPPQAAGQGAPSADAHSPSARRTRLKGPG